MKIIKKIMFIVWISCTSYSVAQAADITEDKVNGTGTTDEIITLEWKQLIPSDYDLEAMENEVIAKYNLETMTQGSPEAEQLITELQQLTDNAPMAKELNGKRVKIPGFIVPLDMDKDKVVAFLLVPYFGACIHTPPPPPNQIIYVKVEDGLKLESTYKPIYVIGEILVETQESDMGNAGYSISHAKIEPYLER